jgi:putative ABC transport system permease protein
LRPNRQKVTVAVILLSGAALFVCSVRHLDHTALGFTPDNLWAVTVEPGMPDQERWDQFYDTLLERTTQLPYVSGAGAVYLKPLSGPIGNDTIPALKGQEGLAPDAPWRKNPHANLESITPGYFRAIGTRLLAGRDFTSADRAEAPNVVIVSASAAERYWPGRNPIGERVIVATARTSGTVQQPRYHTVVGIVEDVRYRGITDPRLDLYLPAMQSVARVKDLLVRTRGEATATQLTMDMRAIARGLDANVRVGTLVEMRDVVAQEIAPWRFAMRMLTGLGALAAVLATVGLIGLVSLVVALRRRELGIRAALGATPARLRVQVLGDTVGTALVATVAGVLGALILGRLVSGLLVGTPPYDPVSLAGAALLTLIAGLIGCLLPAHRAAVSDPTDVLRD